MNRLYWGLDMELAQRVGAQALCCKDSNSNLNPKVPRTPLGVSLSRYRPKTKKKKRDNLPHFTNLEGVRPSQTSSVPQDPLVLKWVRG